MFLRSFAVALTATLALQAQSPLNSNFLGVTSVTNTNPPPVTLYFDVIVTDPAGITINRVDTKCNLNAGTSGSLAVYVTAAGGTHVGNHLNAAAWTQVATANVTHNGGVVPVVLPTPFYLPQGTYGMALHQIGMNAQYSNPATQVPQLPNTYSTAEATLDMVAGRARSSLATAPFGGTSQGSTPRHPNIGLHYSVGPASVDFAGTPTVGSSPLTVAFSPFLFSAFPIVATVWDFGDGNTSNLLNPVHTYTQCGDYTVTLTLIDTQGVYVATKTNYIRTDALQPAFGNTLVSPLTVQFTDLSTGSPQTWAWDFDNDGITDSVAQNPVHTFPSACSEQVVTLTVGRACKTFTLTKRIAVATSLETTFQGGLVTVTGATGGTNFVDVDVQNPQGITVCGMHVNSAVPNGQPVTIKVWQKAGTYVGAVENQSLWRLAGTATGTSLGGNNRTYVSFSPSIHLAFGVHGLGIEHIGASPQYTNLGALTTYSNADLTLTAGLTQASPIFGTVAGGSTQFTPRVWNGALHYSTSASNGAAGYGYIGAGCPGTLGVPGNVATAQPVLGSTASWTVDKLPLDIAIVVLGGSRIPTLDLTFLGMPGCPLFVSPDVTATIIGTANQASFAFPIPNNPVFVGFQVFTQALSLDLGLNPFGFAISDAAVMLVGQ